MGAPGFFVCWGRLANEGVLPYDPYQEQEMDHE